jgi:hypothetical protein
MLFPWSSPRALAPPTLKVGAVCVECRGRVCGGLLHPLNERIGENDRIDASYVFARQRRPQGGNRGAVDPHRRAIWPGQLRKLLHNLDAGDKRLNSFVDLEYAVRDTINASYGSAGGPIMVCNHSDAAWTKRYLRSADCR